MATLNNLLVSGSTTHLNPIKVTTSGQTTTETMAFVSSTGASSRSGFGAIRTDTGLKTFFGTNVNGDRIGIYDEKNTKWILRADASGNITYSGGSVEGNLDISNSTGASVSVTNTTQSHKVTFSSADSGFAGLYDNTNSKWIVFCNSSGNVTLSGNASSADVANEGVAGFRLRAQDTSTQGGRINFLAPASNQAGNVIDNYNSTLRIWGIASSDGTTKTGGGTPLVIDPYAKTITGNYTFNGTASQIQSIVTESSSYSAILFTNTSNSETGAKTLYHSSDAFRFDAGAVSAGTEGSATLILGNNKDKATKNNKRGQLRLYGTGTRYHTIRGGLPTQTSNITLTLPDGANNGWLVGAELSGVGGVAAPVYVNNSGIVTRCTVNKPGSWHNNGVACQTGAILEIGQYIDFHNSTSTNDYDVRLNAGTTRNSLNVVYPVAPTAAGILRNIQISTTDLTAGSSALTNGYVYLVYE